MFPVTSFDRGRDIFTADLSSGVIWVEPKNTNVFGSSSDGSRTCNRMVFLQGWVCSQGSRDGKGYGREG